MSADHMTFENAGWRVPEPEPRRWGARETAVAVGIAVVIAVLGGAAIYAATGHTGHGAGMAGHAFGPTSPGFGAPGAGPPSRPTGAETGGPALHGQFVVAAPAGGYRTMLMQTGTVTAATPTSITVRSADGFSQSYSITGERWTAAVDDAVTVRAVQDGTEARITELLHHRTGDPPR